MFGQTHAIPISFPAGNCGGRRGLAKMMLEAPCWNNEKLGLSMAWFIACFICFRDPHNWSRITRQPPLTTIRTLPQRQTVFGALWVRYRSGSGGARTLYTTSHVVYNVTDGHRSGVFLLFGFLTTWSDWFGASSCNNMCILKGSVRICRVFEPTSANGNVLKHHYLKTLETQPIWSWRQTFQKCKGLRVFFLDITLTLH